MITWKSTHWIFNEWTAIQNTFTRVLQTKTPVNQTSHIIIDRQNHILISQAHQFEEISPISVSEPAHQTQSIHSMALLLETTIGDIVIELDVEGSPELCKNVIKLAHARYYTGNLIYNVVKNRFCQTGDP